MQVVSVVEKDQKGSMPCREKSTPRKQEGAGVPRKRKSTGKEAKESRRGRSGAVTPYKHLGKISDILHLNNENNQLERQARPPKDVLLDAQSWTRAYHLSSRVVAVTTTTETS